MTGQEFKRLVDLYGTQATVTRSLGSVNKTTWCVEIGRSVVHEHRNDGTNLTHIRPGGGKSPLMNDLLRDFCPSKQT